MKNVITFLSICLLLSSCSKSSPADECYTCDVKLSVERLNAATEISTTSETVCGADKVQSFKGRNTWENKTTDTYAKSATTCTKQ